MDESVEISLGLKVALFPSYQVYNHVNFNNPNNPAFCIILPENYVLVFISILVFFNPSYIHIYIYYTFTYIGVI